MASPHVPLADRFWAKVQKTEKCWLWTGYTIKGGYGQIRRDFHGAQVQAHRLSWELHYGPIPTGLCVCHTCDTPACVCPDHLFLGTNDDNMADMVRKGRAASGDRNSMRLYPEKVRSQRGGKWHQPNGESNTATKLTADTVRAIRERYAAGATSQQVLASEYGVHQTQISRIVRRQWWRHI